MIDSSPTSSAESSFRELDEVFLQTQTRIWLGEVISTRFDDDLHLSDALQDGEILFEVSKVVWNLLLTKCMELRHLKHKYGPFGSRRSSGRYRPYSNVDSFIKICKILGLSGIDLFSPSDVVEKRDIRKVCICIRALSKKARSKQLSVPDFDVVKYSVSMSKNMVGVIRKSLESSQCTVSSSSSYSSHKVSQMKLKQKDLYAPCNADDDYSSSEESDEAESRYMGENAFSFSGKFDYADGVNSDLENSPKGRCIDEVKHEHCTSFVLSETARSFPRQRLENDYELDKISSCGVISQKQVYHGVSHVRHNLGNVNFALENDYSVVGDSSCVNDDESSYISDYLAFSDLMVHATDCSNSDIRDGENNMFDFFLNVDSQGPTSNRTGFQNGSQKKLPDDEDTEVSSTTSMSSVLGRLLNLEFDDQFDEDDSLSANVHSSLSKEHEGQKQCKDSFVLCEPHKVDTYETDDNQKTLLFREDVDNRVSTDFGGHISDVASECVKFSYNSKSVEESDNIQLQNINVQGFSVQDTLPVVPDDTTIHISVVQENICETISDNHSRLPFEDMDEAQEDTPVTYNAQANISSAAENGTQGNSTGKHGRRPLLRTVVKGTAIAGVLFLLLHISTKSKGNNAQETKQYGQVSKYNESKSSSMKRQNGRVGRGIYPAEKIKL